MSLLEAGCHLCYDLAEEKVGTEEQIFQCNNQLMNWLVEDMAVPPNSCSLWQLELWLLEAHERK